jgi:integrase
MAYAEKRGKSPRPWRVKYKLPNGTESSESGFETKQAALAWGRDQEAKIRTGTWTDPNAGKITVNDWIDRWVAVQNVGPSTESNREYLIRKFLRPQWGKRLMDSLSGEEITIWENGLPAATGVSRRTARDARSLMGTILGDAVAAMPPLLLYNPAVRPRNRGRKTGRRLDRSPQRAWATPLEALLLAERAALLSGRDEEFTMLVTIAYTGMRWGETIGLERDLLLPSLINVEWQLREISGMFHRLAPKDDSYRSTNWEPYLPVDLPPFLADLLTAQTKERSRERCACVGQHGGSGRYVFLSPEGGHYRRSNYARRVFRPACDGRYELAGKGGKLVIVDAVVWPGVPVAHWPPAMAGHPFMPPGGRGVARLVSSDGSGHCASCGHSVNLRRDGNVVAHKIGPGPCPGSGKHPAPDAFLGCWLPVRSGLTPHGLRHSHKTWMAEDGIPEILAEQRLGHEVPGIRGVYAHASQRMRDRLTAALQTRWEESLRERAAIFPHSPVLLLDGLLARILGGSIPPNNGPQKLIAQIPPKTTKDPIPLEMRSVR